jgi:hypothetical protein
VADIDVALDGNRIESARAVVSHVFIKMNAMVIAHVRVEWLLSGGEGNRLYGRNEGATPPRHSSGICHRVGLRFLTARLPDSGGCGQHAAASVQDDPSASRAIQQALKM